MVQIFFLNIQGHSPLYERGTEHLAAVFPLFITMKTELKSLTANIDSKHKKVKFHIDC